MKRFRDKVVVVVGAGSAAPGLGNGKAACILYAREGARLLAADVNRDAAEETQRLVAAEGECLAHTVDVQTEDSVAAMIDAADCRSSHRNAGAAYSNRICSLQRAADAATRAWNTRRGEGGHSGSPRSPRAWHVGWRNRTVMQRYVDITCPPPYLSCSSCPSPWCRPLP